MMEHRIAKKKLNFYQHLVHLPVYTLAYEIANLQATLSYPGLISECEKLISHYDLPVVTSTNKWGWKKLVNIKTKERNRLTF